MSTIEGRITFPPLDCSQLSALGDLQDELWPGEVPLDLPKPWLTFVLDAQGRAAGLERNPERAEWGRAAENGIALLREFVALNPGLAYSGHLDYMNDAGSDPVVLTYRCSVLPSPSGVAAWVYVTRPPRGGADLAIDVAAGELYAASVDNAAWPDPATDGLALKPECYIPVGTSPERCAELETHFQQDLSAWVKHPRRCPDAQDLF